MLQKCVLNKEPHEDHTVRTDDETEAQLVCDKASLRSNSRAQHGRFRLNLILTGALYNQIYCKQLFYCHGFAKVKDSKIKITLFQ